MASGPNEPYARAVRLPRMAGEVRERVAVSAAASGGGTARSTQLGRLLEVFARPAAGPDEVVQAVLHRLEELLPGAAAALCETEPGEGLVSVTCRGRRPTQPRAQAVLAAAAGGRYRRSAGPGGLRALAMPLVARRQVLWLERGEQLGFGAAERELLEVAACHLDAQLERYRRTRQLSVLAAHAASLSQLRPLTAESVLAGAEAVIGELLDTDATAALAIEDATARVVAHHRLRRDLLVGWTCPVADLGAAQVVTSKTSQLGTDLASLSRHSTADRWTLRAYLAVPVLAEGTVVALLYALRRSAIGFDADDTAALELLAGQVGGALERLHAVAAADRRRRQAEELRVVTRDLGSSLDPATVLERVAAALLEQMPSGRIGVLLLDEAGRYLRPVLIRGRDADRFQEQWAEALEEVPLTGSRTMREVMDRVHRVVRHPGDVAPSPLGRTYRAITDSTTTIYEPLVAHGEGIGVVMLELFDGAPDPGPAMLDRIELVVAAAAVALRHAGLYQRAQQDRAQLGALHDVTLTIGGSEDLTATLQQITNAAARLTGARRCRLGLRRDPGNYQLVAVSGDDSAEAGAVYEMGVAVGGWIIQTGQSAWLPDAAAGVSEPAEAVQRVRRREGSSLGVPLRGRDSTVLGFLSLHHPRPGHFPRDVLALLERFAAEAVLAVDNHAQQLERRELELRLRQQAHHDSLTGVANRSLLLERLSRAIPRARGDSLVGVVYLDLDRFKSVNDSLGHAAGDELLVEVAARLQRLVRPADVVARLGGDEFVVLAENVPQASGVTQLADRILAALAVPITVAGAAVFVDASIGIVTVAGRGRDPGQVLRDADIAMYQAKAAGKGRHVTFRPQMRARAVGRLPVETELRAALDAGELTAFYQPIVEIANGRIRGVEALVRWPHPRRGLVNPSEFIPIAEETGLIARIDDLVLREASQQVVAWQRTRGHPDLELHVNFSAVSLHQPGVADRVADAVRDSGLTPRHLTVELTETAAMRDPSRSLAVFAQLRRLGARVAIDDFGTGYSNLAYLRRFPVDGLKIDREFIGQLGSDAQADSLVAAMLSLARSLGLTVTAEGVETPAQARRLNELGCLRAQGYLYARPLATSALTSLLVAEVPTLPAPRAAGLTAASGGARGSASRPPTPLGGRYGQSAAR